MIIILSEHPIPIKFYPARGGMVEQSLVIIVLGVVASLCLTAIFRMQLSQISQILAEVLCLCLLPGLLKRFLRARRISKLRALGTVLPGKVVSIQNNSFTPLPGGRGTGAGTEVSFIVSIEVTLPGEARPLHLKTEPLSQIVVPQRIGKAVELLYSPAVKSYLYLVTNLE